MNTTRLLHIVCCDISKRCRPPQDADCRLTPYYTRAFTTTLRQFCLVLCLTLIVRGQTSFGEDEIIGDALHDPKNPIRQLYRGERLDLWSLQPIVRPSIPKVQNELWCRNGVDRFLLSVWEANDTAPAPSIDRRQFARRTSLDIVGLPPEIEDVNAFVDDERDEATELWVERLLASPRYGEHWARMWLDVVRYSDSNGFDWDEYRKNAWKYRDYVVRSWNQDKPFDQFVIEQIAGDELNRGAPTNTIEQDRLIATGYLRMGPHDNAAGLFNEQDRARAELMTDLTETTSAGLLGLTMSCCRCHDHKTDPLSHADHYRFRAFFAACNFADDVPLDLETEQSEIKRHNDDVDRKIKSAQEKIDTIVLKVTERNPKELENAERAAKKKKKSVDGMLPVNKAKELMNDDERVQFDEFTKIVSSLRDQKKSFQHGLLMSDKQDSVDVIRILNAGDHRTPLEEVKPGFPSVLFPNEPTMVAPVSDKTIGRRLTLANWIVARDNPWTARVIVNRIWQKYFGVGIVSTPNDFGITGGVPSNPELLDYLASELIDSGWSIKHIQRLIVTSSAYRQVAHAETHSAAPHSQSAHSMMRRLSAEQIRDSILAVSGLLQHRNGGPPIWPELSPEILQANPAVLDDNETKTKGWYPSAANEQSVRSIYLIQKRTLKLPWMEIFDLPDNAVSCSRREASIVAPQALSLMNGTLSAEASRSLADRVRRENRREQILALFGHVLQREPLSLELETCEQYLESHTLEELSLVLINLNEFVFVP